MTDGTYLQIREDSDRLATLNGECNAIDSVLIIQLLKRDQVILIKNLNAEQADAVMQDVALQLGLLDNLKLQAGFASIEGHRSNIGKYFMSVNRRDDYQFIPPHSEGSSFVGMELASFFCYENSTDGGETILMNVDGSSKAWDALREKVRRAKKGFTPLAPSQIARVRGLYQLRLPDDVLKDGDEVLQEYSTEFPNLTVVDALTTPRKSRSRILDRELNVYWDTIASIDFDSAAEYERLLRQSGLLKEPRGGLTLQQMDNAAPRHLWHSGVKYEVLFRSKVTRKMAAGDLIIINNMTWAHSVCNWSAGSGTRNIAASFA